MQLACRLQYVCRAKPAAAVSDLVGRRVAGAVSYFSLLQALEKQRHGALPPYQSSGSKSPLGTFVTVDSTSVSPDGAPAG